ncbi:transcriptional regulator MalT [Klebsiella michiganensis]|uniref:Transcriptional regulator MalT n=1 Tax=Klebsiella michiganensis TaxID=1134687 RepID=A0A7H4M4R6_9ENTR|nr:transcriptional regulator MalT [Klebsiella michiganensis]
MRFFLRHQPENMTLVVLSRNLPQLGIANLRVRDQLLEIAASSWLLPIRKPSSFSTVVSVRPLRPTTAKGCATMLPAGPPRYS